MFRGALSVFEINAGRFPTTEEGLAALVEKPEGSDLKEWEATLRAEQLDPWGNPYGYRYPPTQQNDLPDVTGSVACTGR